MADTTIIQQLAETGIIPVVTLTSTKHSVPLAKALLLGGLPVAEVTLRTEEALDSLKLMRQSYPDMLLGAGTVLNAGQAQNAVDAGARFIVSPGVCPEVITWCLEKHVPVFPGICTPTEVCQALNMGVRNLKFFPASVFGGLQTVKALLSVFPDIRLMPTGGISLTNATDYLRISGVLCCGGSFVAPQTLLSEENFAAITQIVIKAVSLVKQVKQVRNNNPLSIPG